MSIGSIEKAFSAALNFARNACGKKFQARVCEISGAHPPNLSAILNRGGGCSEELRRKIIDAVAQLLPEFPARDYESFLNLGEWLSEGKHFADWRPPVRGEIVANIPAFRATAGATTEHSSNISPGPPIQKKIPVVSWVQAGGWSDVVDQYQPGYAEEWIDTAATNHPNAFALTVRGDSMEPEFTEGDIITVDPGRAYCSGSFVVAKNGEEATFKQLILDGTNVFLKPLNERYPIKDMTGVEMRIVGVVVEKRKRY